MTSIVECIDELIGNTSMIHLRSLSDAARGINVYGKLESTNPGMSVKDRGALEMLRQAEIDHHLTAGWTIVESSSGNTGHSLAMLCAAFGYEFICVLDPKTPKANISLVKAFGGRVELVTTPDETGNYQTKRIARAKEIAATTNHCINLDQYGNPAAVHAHIQSTGPEIFRGLGGNVNIIIGSVSTGSHFSGVACYMKQQSETITTIAVEPVGSSVFGGAFHPYLQNGSGLSFQPGNIWLDYVDEAIKVTDRDAFLQCRLLARSEGLLLGSSCGSVLHAARTVIAKLDGPANIVLLLADGGLKYLDTIYNDYWLQTHGLADVIEAAAELYAASHSRPCRIPHNSSSTPDDVENEARDATYRCARPGFADGSIRFCWPSKLSHLLEQNIISLLRRTSATAPIIGFGTRITEVQALNFISDLKSDLTQRKLSLMTVIAETGELVGMCLIKGNMDPNNRHIATLTKGIIRDDIRGRIVLPAAFYEIALRCERNGVNLVVLDVRAGTAAYKTWLHSGFRCYGTLDDYARVDGFSLAGHFMAQPVDEMKSRAGAILRSRLRTDDLELAYV